MAIVSLVLQEICKFIYSLANCMIESIIRWLIYKNLAVLLFLRLNEMRWSKSVSLLKNFFSFPWIAYHFPLLNYAARSWVAFQLLSTCPSVSVSDTEYVFGVQTVFNPCRGPCKRAFLQSEMKCIFTTTATPSTQYLSLFFATFLLVETLVVIWLASTCLIFIIYCLLMEAFSNWLFSWNYQSPRGLSANLLDGQ